MTINAPITTRAANGSALSWQQMDSNLTSLQTGISSAGTQIDAFKSSTGASLIGIGNGRTQADKNAETIDVRDYITTNIDGVTSNQAGIVAAVAAAYAAGSRLFWPAGTYVSDANIPNFHSVQHVGDGVVKRGTDTFKIAQRGNQSNIIYVSTFGSASNDGLTSDLAIAESAIPSVLTNWGPVLNGFWTIQFAAGTYGGGWNITGLRSVNYIQFLGAPVGGHPNVPTTIIDGTSSIAQHGWFLQDRMTIKVQDVKFQNWTTAAFSHGLVATTYCKVWTINVHSANCNYGGIDIEDKSILIMGGGIHNNTGYSIRGTYHSTVSLGYGGTASANRPQISGARTGGAGVWLSEYSQGHIDYCDIFDCNSSGGGVQLTNNARADINYTTFGGAGGQNYYNIRCDTGSTFIDNTGNVFNTPIIKSIVLWGMSIDWTNNQNVYFDSSTSRFRIGPSTSLSPIAAITAVAGISGASVNTSTSILSESAGTNYLTLASPGASGTESGILIAKPGSSLFGKWIYDFTDNAWKMSMSSTVSYEFSSTYLIPRADNTKTLGSGTFRWSTVYAVTGTINTSDEREKQDIRSLSDAEIAVAKDLKAAVKTYRWKASFAEKGDNARIHFGWIAQEVIATFEKHGLNAFDYGCCCYDEWDELPELRDKEGNIIQEYRPAGDRYGVRLDEIMAFIISVI